MTRRGLRVGFFLSIVACSSVPAAEAPASDDAGAAAPSSGGPRGDSGAAPDDASSSPDTGKDAGADAAASSWRCGHGTFTQADSVAACALPNLYLDSGPGAAPRYCDGATITGGSWEVWCSSGNLLVKLHVDGLTGTSSHAGCAGLTERKVYSAWAQLNGSGSGMMPKAGAPLAYDVSKSVAVDLATLGNTAHADTGTGTLFLLSEFPAACAALPARAVMGGVNVSWNAATND